MAVAVRALGGNARLGGAPWDCEEAPNTQAGPSSPPAPTHTLHPVPPAAPAAPVPPAAQRSVRPRRARRSISSSSAATPAEDTPLSDYEPSRHPDIATTPLPDHWRVRKILPAAFHVRCTAPVPDGTLVVLAALTDDGAPSDLRKPTATTRDGIAAFPELRFLATSGRGKRFSLKISVHGDILRETILKDCIKITADGPRTPRMRNRSSTRRTISPVATPSPPNSHSGHTPEPDVGGVRDPFSMAVSKSWNSAAVESMGASPTHSMHSLHTLAPQQLSPHQHAPRQHVDPYAAHSPARQLSPPGHGYVPSSMPRSVPHQSLVVPCSQDTIATPPPVFTPSPVSTPVSMMPSQHAGEPPLQPEYTPQVYTSTHEQTSHAGFNRTWDAIMAAPLASPEHPMLPHLQPDDVAEEFFDLNSLTDFALFTAPPPLGPKLLPNSNTPAWPVHPELHFKQMFCSGNICTVVLEIPVNAGQDVGFGITFGKAIPKFDFGVCTQGNEVTIKFVIPHLTDAGRSKVDVVALIKMNRVTYQATSRQLFTYE
eukprot:m.117587 g.117587  ORF g.117587 m.117587 type:complete len:540 (-) comp9520_c0_seq3:430-2049(-)